MAAHRVDLQLFLLQGRKKVRLLLELSECFLCLPLSFESLLMDVILETLAFEFELVILGLKDSPRGSLVFDLLGMLDEKVVLVHLGEVTLFSDLD